MVGFRILSGLSAKPINLRLPTSPSFLIPAFPSDIFLTSKTSSERDVKWVEGIRSIAALLVITCHLWTAFDLTILQPRLDAKTPPTLWQRPFIRILSSGRPSVAMFFVLTGFTNALKPLKLTHAGNSDAALRSLTCSIPRRFVQLMFPAAVATVFSWALCQAGAFNMATHVDSAWIVATTPRPSDTIPQAVSALGRSLLSTWTSETNYFDRVQWCLEYLVGGSMMVYITMIGTLRAAPSRRMMVVFGFFVYSWLKRDSIIGTNVFAGILFAEISLNPPEILRAKSSMISRKALSGGLIVSGAYLASYPEFRPDLSVWSLELMNVGLTVFPLGSDISRFYSSIGCILLFLGISSSNGARSFLSHPIFSWLGRLSYPIYLLHAPLLRSILVWCVYGSSPQPRDAKGVLIPGARIPKPGMLVLFFWIPVYIAIVIYFAHLWTMFVDPCVAWATRTMEEALFSEEESDEKVISLV